MARLTAHQVERLLQEVDRRLGPFAQSRSVVEQQLLARIGSRGYAHVIQPGARGLRATTVGEQRMVALALEIEQLAGWCSPRQLDALSYVEARTRLAWASDRSPEELRWMIEVLRQTVTTEADEVPV